MKMKLHDFICFPERSPAPHSMMGKKRARCIKSRIQFTAINIEFQGRGGAAREVRRTCGEETRFRGVVMEILTALILYVGLCECVHKIEAAPHKQLVHTGSAIRRDETDYHYLPPTTYCLLPTT